MHVHESRSAAPVGFVKGGAAPADTVMTMLIALTQNNPAGLEKAVMDVSTPGNALYGQHLTKEQVSPRRVVYIDQRLRSFCRSRILCDPRKRRLMP